jgi:hypothetical protein
MIRDYRSDFERIWIYYKGERAIFLRTTKTFGSPFIHVHCTLKLSDQKYMTLTKLYIASKYFI